MGFESFINDTRNQHFVSRAEQRLNSCSDDPFSKKAGIYCFDVVDGASHCVKLKGKKTIGNNLSFGDLFTLSRYSDKERINLEGLFKRYEDCYPAHVTSVLNWVASAQEAVGGESKSVNLESVKDCNFSELIISVKLIYTFKMMSWIRNPYKVKEVLKSFGSYSKMRVLKPDALSLYFSLVRKNESEEKHICSTYNITSEEYRAWLHLIILFLYSEVGEATILDGFVEEFFLADEFTTAVLIYAYDEKCALLTDTGVVKDLAISDPSVYMNISKHCIIALQHARVESTRLDELLNTFDVPVEHRDAVRGQLKASLSRKVFGSLYWNNHEVLAGYNQICVKAAAFQVFSASNKVDGVLVSSVEDSKINGDGELSAS